VIIDRRTPVADRAAMLIEALADFDTDALFLPPRVREALQSKRARAAGESGAPASPPSV